MQNIDAAPDEMRRRLVVTWKEIDKWIALRLQAHGFDMSREILSWSLIDDGVSIVYEQRVDAPIRPDVLAREAEKKRLDERPSYLPKR